MKSNKINWFKVLNRCPETTGNFINLNGHKFELGFFSRSHVDNKPMIWYGNGVIIIKHVGGEYVTSSANVAPVNGGYLVEFSICNGRGLVVGRSFAFVCSDDLNGRFFHSTQRNWDKLREICDGLNDGVLCADDYKFVYKLF